MNRLRRWRSARGRSLQYIQPFIDIATPRARKPGEGEGVASEGIDNEGGRRQPAPAFYYCIFTSSSLITYRTSSYPPPRIRSLLFQSSINFFHAVELIGQTVLRKTCKIDSKENLWYRLRLNNIKRSKFVIFKKSRIESSL